MTPIRPENLLRHELIGLNVRIAKSCNKQLIGMRGMIIDETRNTLTINDGQERKVVPKHIATFRVWLPDGTLVEVDGRRLVGRPENRVKVRVRRW